MFAMKKKCYLFCIVFILVICYCSKTEIKEIKDIQLKKEFEISAESTDRLESIALHSYDNKGNIYIYDDINMKVVVFDSTGNYSYKFGRYGSGPGEFKYIATIVPTLSYILIMDYSKSSIIKYDYNGKFISEKKISLISTEKAVADGDILLTWYQMYLEEGNKIILKRGIGVFSESLKLIKNIYSVKEEYNPWIIDPNIVSSVFSLNKLNGNIAVSEIYPDEFKVHIFNKNYELIKTLSLNIPPIKYAEKTFNELQEYYNKYGETISKQYGKKVEVKKMNKCTRLVKGIAYDRNSNLWIATPEENEPEKVRIIIFDKNYQLKGVFHTELPLGKMHIRNNNLIYGTGTSSENSKIIGYTIIKK